MVRSCLHMGQGPFHTIANVKDVITVIKKLDPLAEGYPVNVGTPSSYSLGIVSGLCECSECLHSRLSFFFLPLFPVPDRQYWLETNQDSAVLFCRRCPERTGVVDGITDVIPPLFSTTGRAVFKGILDEVG